LQIDKIIQENIKEIPSSNKNPTAIKESNNDKKEEQLLKMNMMLVKI